MPENPRLLSVWMNGILSKSQLAGAERIFSMRKHASRPETWALAQGVVHLVSDFKKLFGFFYCCYFTIENRGKLPDAFDKLSTTMSQLSWCKEKIIF